MAGVGTTTPDLGLRGLGTLDRVGIIALFVLGLVRWRRQLLPLAGLAAAVVLSVPKLVPLGTGRTDAYLYPAIAMVVAEGATVAWRWVRRRRAELAVGVLALAVAFGGLLAADRVLHRPGYPGGDFRQVTAAIDQQLAHGGLVVVGGTARWPWAYYDAHRVRIVHSDLYNNGYFPRSDDARVLVIPGSAIEGGYQANADRAALVVAKKCRPVLYVEAGDWTSMPMGLLRTLTTSGGLEVTRGPNQLGSYRAWWLRPVHGCGGATQPLTLPGST